MAQQSSGKHFTYIYRFIIKDTNECPDEEVYWVRSRRTPSTGAYVPVELGYATLLTMDVFTNPEGLQISLFEFL